MNANEDDLQVGEERLLTSLLMEEPSNNRSSLIDRDRRRREMDDWPWHTNHQSTLIHESARAVTEAIVLSLIDVREKHQ